MFAHLFFDRWPLGLVMDAWHMLTITFWLGWLLMLNRGVE
jgi:putative copper export protein